MNSLKVYTGLLFPFSKVFSCNKKCGSLEVIFFMFASLSFLRKIIPPEAINILR